MSNLYISDLDGTLLNNRAELSDFTRNNLNLLLEKGLDFTVASARSVISMQKILKGLAIKLPVIEFNGSFISDLKTGKHVAVNQINPEIKENILLDILREDQLPFISSFNGQKDLLYYSEIKNEGSNWYLNNRIKARDQRLTFIKKLNKVLKEYIICFTVINLKENLDELYFKLDQKYGKDIELHIIENDYSPGWYWLTVHDRKATKDQAIKELVKITGHKMRDLSVFGDNVNDMKMFRKAAKAIAVANAKDILKEHATEIIGSNEEDSVAKYLLKEKII